MQIAFSLLLFGGFLVAQAGASDSAPTGASFPQVSVVTLKGAVHEGELRRLTTSTLVMKGPTGEQQFSYAELLQVDFDQPTRRPTPPKQQVQVVLVDGSRIDCENVNSFSANANLMSSLFGTVSLPRSAIASIRLEAFDSKVDIAWNELASRDIRQDLLVVRKDGDVLDHLDGVVGDIDDGSIKFLLDADEIPINRKKIFGIVYYRRPATTGHGLCRAQFVDGQLLQVLSLDWNAGTAKATLVSGATVIVRFDQLASLDFSLGKVLYLSEIEPREMKYTPFFDEEWFYLRNRTIDGEPLSLAKKRFTRGLSIHAKTSLLYRIGDEYRRFQAVMGIDDEFAGNPGGADVRFVIRGDGKVLFEAEVRGADKNGVLARPQELDVDVSGVRDLEILVDFIDENDIGLSDWLNLADARVTK